MAGPLINRVRERVRANHPLAAAVADGVRAAAERADTALQPADIPAVVEAVQTAIARDPVATSSVNAEPWWQNRVKVGLVIAALGLVLNRMGIDLGLSPEDKELVTTLIVAFGGGLAALGEWLAKWLAGIDWRRPWTLFGIGR